MRILVITLGVAWLGASFGANQELIAVKLGMLQGQASPKERLSDYERGLEAALFYAIGENDKRLNQCGYELEARLSYFDDDDKLSAKERAQALEKEGAWAIFGPLSSYPFLVARKGLTETAMVSAMAGARAVTSLPPPFFTMYPAIDELANGAVVGAEKGVFGRHYGALIDASCPSCKDFGEEFARQSQGKFERLFWIDVVGNTPDLLGLMTELAAKPVDFLLIPNFSSLSAYVIKQVHEKFPAIKFVGADFWGDEQVPNLDKYNLPLSVRGIHVRGGPSASNMRDYYKVRSLRREHAGRSVLPDFASFMLVDFVRRLSDELCQLKPKDKAAFLAYLKRLKPDHFKTDMKVAVFTLEGPKVNYAYVVSK